VILYFLDEPVRPEGDCDDGWVWASFFDRKGKTKHAWFWMPQLTAAPRGA
jgi:hypothetical protein